MNHQCLASSKCPVYPTGTQGGAVLLEMTFERHNLDWSINRLFLWSWLFNQKCLLQKFNFYLKSFYRILKSKDIFKTNIYTTMMLLYSLSQWYSVNLAPSVVCFWSFDYLSIFFSLNFPQRLKHVISNVFYLLCTTNTYIPLQPMHTYIIISKDDTQTATSGTSSSGLSTTRVIKWAKGAFLFFLQKKTCWNSSNMTTWEAKCYTKMTVTQNMIIKKGIHQVILK